MHYKFPQNPNLQNILTASPNLMICPDCEGTGSNPKYDELNSILFKIQTNWKRPDEYVFIENCQKCLGDGYIDWVENATDKKHRDCNRFMSGDIRHTSILFLYSCLYADNQFVSEFLEYDPNTEEYSLDSEIFTFIKTLKYFSMYVPLVEKYLLNIDKETFETGIKNGLIFNGLVCANCFFINSDEFRVRDDKKYYINRPKIGDKIDTNEFIAPDDSSVFWLCDKCKNELASEQVDIILSKMYTEKFPNGLDPEYYKIFSENIKIKVFY